MAQYLVLLYESNLPAFVGRLPKFQGTWHEELTAVELPQVVALMLRASLTLYHLPLMALLVMLMLSINPMIYVLDQLHEHVPSYCNNR
jgi:hypothetical protein